MAVPRCCGLFGVLGVLMMLAQLLLVVATVSAVQNSARIGLLLVRTVEGNLSSSPPFEFSPASSLFHHESFSTVQHT